MTISTLFARPMVATLALVAAAIPLAAKQITTADGQTCIVVDENGLGAQSDTGSGNSTSVTAGSGSVSSSTTINGKTTTTTGPAVSSSSAGSSASSGDTTASTSSSTSSGPGGTITVTRGADGKCIITRSQP